MRVAANPTKIQWTTIFSPIFSHTLVRKIIKKKHFALIATIYIYRIFELKLFSRGLGDVVIVDFSLIAIYFSRRVACICFTVPESTYVCQFGGSLGVSVSRRPRNLSRELGAKVKSVVRLLPEK